MRVIAGALGGRVFAAPAGHRTHPMSDRVRGGLFNTLGDIRDFTVLDAFAGSGALAIEALSRGAARTVLIERDRAAQRAIQQNLQTLGLPDRTKLVAASAQAWCAAQTTTVKFDLILCDPPYDDLQLPLLNRLTGLLRETGWLVLSWPGKQTLPPLSRCQLQTTRAYGDAQLGFYSAGSGETGSPDISR